MAKRRKEGCDKPGHAKHMCKVSDEGKFKLAAKFAENAEFICKQCGRSARDKKNLCVPVSITNILYLDKEE